MQVKEDETSVRWEGTLLKPCWHLPCLWFILSYHETITLYHPVCAISQEYFGTLIPVGHWCCSGAADRMWSCGIIPASAEWFGFPPLCQHSHMWKRALIQSSRGQTGSNALTQIFAGDQFRQQIPEQVIGRSESWLWMEGKVTVIFSGQAGRVTFSRADLQQNRVCYSYVLLASILLDSSQDSTLSVCAVLGCFDSACLPAHSPFSLLSPAFSLFLIPCGFAAH